MNLTQKDQNFATFSFPEAEHESIVGSGRPGDEYLDWYLSANLCLATCYTF